MVAREGFRYAALLQQRHTNYGRIRGMVVGEGGRSTGVLLYWRAALNTCLLSSEVRVACGVSPTQTMDDRECVTG